MALDGGLQLITDYESTNALRFLTGGLAGWFGGFVLAALIISTKVVTSNAQKASTVSG
jgi:uncharacterized membrane protein